MASLSAPFSLEIQGLCWRVRSSPCPASQCVPKSHSPLPQNDLAQQSPGRPRAWHLLGAGFSPSRALLHTFLGHPTPWVTSFSKWLCTGAVEAHRPSSNLMLQ